MHNNKSYITHKIKNNIKSQPQNAIHVTPKYKYCMNCPVVLLSIFMLSMFMVYEIPKAYKNSVFFQF